MTFSELLLWFVGGYALGLMSGPHVSTRRRGWRSVSPAVGVAGGLGASAPYVLLHSIWVQQVLTDDYPTGGFSRLIAFLAANVTAVCIISCTAAIITGGLIYNAQSHPNPAQTDPTPTDSGVPRPNSRNPTRKTAIWLILCAPAIIFSLWHRLSGEPIGLTWPTYLFAALFLMGLLGYGATKAIRFLRS